MTFNIRQSVVDRDGMPRENIARQYKEQLIELFEQSPEGQTLQEEMSNPANFGIAKSFVMMGQERGFDMTSEEDLNAWMATYNAELAAGVGPRIPLPGERSESARKVQDKLRRKMTRDSRRRNRKKK